MTGPLAHLRVVEIAHDVPAAWCARQFAEWGADVVVIEPDSGSELRALEPLVRGADGEEVSLLWLNVAAGKRFQGLGGKGSGSAELAALLEQADVLVCDWAASALIDAAIDLDRARTRNPRLITVELSAFGSGGPYAPHQATELILQALSGFMVLNGDPARYPLKAAGYLASYSAGINAFVAALAALYERRQSGLGQRIEVSAFEAITSLVPLLRTEYSGADAVRQNGPTSGTIMFPCRDGYIAMNPSAGRNWEDLLVALDATDGDIPDGLRGESKPPHLVRAFLEQRLKGLPARSAYRALNDLRIAAGVAQSPLDLLEDHHLGERPFFRETEDSQLGKVTFTGPPFRITAARSSGGPEPAGMLGSSQVRLEPRPPAATRPSTGPLSGLKILDLTQAWLGPYASMLLADLGAEVIKVESLSRPDSWRSAGTSRRAPSITASADHWTTKPANPNANALNTSGSFNGVNRGKRSLNLDLTTLEGKAALLDLVRLSDAVMENFTPRVMSNFGLGYDRLSAENPRLVMAAFSGYGASGSYKDYRANGATTDATCGWAYLVGYPDGPPTMMGIMEADPLAGLHMASGVLVGLEARAQTGDGYFLEGAMLEAGANYIGEEILLASVIGSAPPRRGNRSLTMAPHGVFPTVGHDAWIAIAARSDQEWQALCDTLSSPALDALRDAPLSVRLARVDELEDALACATRGLDARQLADRLQAAGVPAAPVQKSSEVLEDQQLVAVGWFQRLAHPDMGAHRYNGFPWRFSRTPPAVQCRPPLHGEHSVEVLTEVLGYSNGVVRDWIQKGVTGSRVAALTD